MKLIVCLDNNNGLLFNKRRISSDIAVTERIIKLVGNHRLWVSSYSSALFPKLDNVIVDDEFLSKSNVGDYCFVENSNADEYLSKCSGLVIYSWNRKYPSDFKFPKDKALSNKRCVSIFEFKGNSHEKITEEIYE